MLGKRTKQANITDCDNEYLDFVGQDTFYGYLAAHRHEIFRDEDFANLYCKDNGRESVPPSLLAVALLLQWYDGTSDEETINRVKYDLRWKVALGLKMKEEPFVKSTLWLFRTQLIVHEEALKIFETSLKHARQQGYFKSRKVKAILDTTPIIGKGAVEDTYNLLAESIREVLRVLSRLEDKKYETFASEHDMKRYTEPSFKGSVSIDWDNKDQRQVVLNSLVADCDRVLVLAKEELAKYPPESEEGKEILEATEILSKILTQDVKRTSKREPVDSSTEGNDTPSGDVETTEANTQRASSKPSSAMAGTGVQMTQPKRNSLDDGEADGAEIIQGVAVDRMISVHDPEMRHGRKSSSNLFDGYKGAISVDGENQLITAVKVLPGNAHDSAGMNEMIEQTESNTGSDVETVIGDTAYGSVEQRIEAEEAGRVLISPVAKAPETGRFTKEDFSIDIDKVTVTCPAGQTTSQIRMKKEVTKSGRVFKNRVFLFLAQVCQKCPLLEKCVKPGSKKRSVTVHEYERVLQKAREFQRTEEFRKLYHPRSAVEHRIARLVQLGLRKARYFGTKKVLFQLAMVAAVANFTLVAARTAILSPLLSLLIYIFVVVFAILNPNFARQRPCSAS